MKSRDRKTRTVCQTEQNQVRLRGVAKTPELPKIKNDKPLLLSSSIFRFFILPKCTPKCFYFCSKSACMFMNTPAKTRKILFSLLLTFFSFFSLISFDFLKTMLFIPMMISRNVYFWQARSFWQNLKKRDFHMFQTHLKHVAKHMRNTCKQLLQTCSRHVRTCSQRLWSGPQSYDLYLMIQGLGGLCAKQKVEQLHELTKRVSWCELYVSRVQHKRNMITRIFAKVCFFTFPTFVILVTLFILLYLHRKVISSDFKILRISSFYFSEKVLQTGVKAPSNEVFRASQTRVREAFSSRTFCFVTSTSFFIF